MNDEILQTEQIRDKLIKYIEKERGIIAVSFSAPQYHLYFGINDTIVMHAASTMKVPVMCELFKEIQAGQIHLKDSIKVKNRFFSIVDGSPYSLDINDDSADSLYSLIGQKVTLELLIHDMITVSGNLATNILIEIAGIKNIQNLMEHVRAPGMTVLRGVEDIKAYRQGRNNTTDARSLTAVFESILNGSICDREYSRAMIDILKQQKFRKKIPARLPASVEVANKTGSITAISHDAGIIFPADHPPYILSVLTSGLPESRAEECIAFISEQIYLWYMSEQ